MITVQDVELRAGTFIVARLCNLERTLRGAHVIGLGI